MQSCKYIIHTTSLSNPYQRFHANILIFRKETVPLIRDVPGLEQFQGPVQHSHDFRTADRYKDQTVLCVGSGPSAIEIAGIIATQAAKQVKCLKL